MPAVQGQKGLIYTGEHDIPDLLEFVLLMDKQDVMTRASHSSDRWDSKGGAGDGTGGGKGKKKRRRLIM